MKPQSLQMKAKKHTFGLNGNNHYSYMVFPAHDGCAWSNINALFGIMNSGCHKGMLSHNYYQSTHTHTHT